MWIVLTEEHAIMRLVCARALMGVMEVIADYFRPLPEDPNFY